MKSYNLDYLLEDDEFIKNSIVACCKNKKKKKNRNNAKYYQAKHILNSLDRYTEKIKNILKNYKPSKYRTFQIKDNGTGKIRDITSVPLFPDQIIHQIIVDSLKSVLMKKFYTHSYASIPERGTHKAKKYIEKVIRKNPKEVKYILKIDIKKFYLNIDHEIIKNKLRKLLRGYKLYQLIETVVDSYPQGLPIGFTTSQWLGNFLLTDLDYFIKQDLQVKFSCRYMDDVVIFGRNKKELHKILNKIMLFLDNFKLVLKKNYQVFRFIYEYKGKVRGRFLDYVGFKFYKTYTTIRKRTCLKLIRTAKKIIKNKSNARSHLAQSFFSLKSWAKHSDSYNLYEKYFKKIKIKKLKGVIRNESRKFRQANCTV